MKPDFKSVLFTSVLIFVIVANILYAEPQWPFTAHPGNPVLQKGPGWDAGIVFVPHAIYLDGLFYLFYTGTNQQQVTPYAIGYATSDDGYNFTKYPSNPVFEGDGSGFDSTEVTMGALLMEGDSLILYYNGSNVGRAASIYPFDNWVRRDTPVLEKGSPGEWDSGFVGVASVLKTDNGYMMYYSGGLTPPPGAARWEIGMATSTDGIHWSKYDDPATTNPPYAESDPVLQPGPIGSWDYLFTWLPSVLKSGNYYEMFYFGGTPGAFGYAVSNDGINWTKDSQNNPFYVRNDDPYAVSSGGIIETPSLVLKDSVYYMYYDYGFNVGEIGMATAKRKSAILQVPADYPTIQGGIDAAIDGDTVLVADSTYYENINFRGKAITVASHYLMDGDTNHISNTIIDGSQPSNPDSGSVVTLSSGEDTTSVLCGFTITGGTGTILVPGLMKGGGGINFFNSGGKVINNKVISNTVSNYANVFGGGISSGPPEDNHLTIIEKNTIQNNSCTNGTMATSSAGVGLATNGRFSNNTVKENLASSSIGQVWAGGATFAYADSVWVCNNYIFNNKALNNSYADICVGVGLFFFQDTSSYIRAIGNVIYDNEIKSNYWAAGAGVGFEQSDGDILFANNLVYNNYYNDNGLDHYHGGGIYVNRAEVSIANNTVTLNRAYDGGAVCSSNSELADIRNNILWGNIAVFQTQIDIYAGSSPSFTYNDIEGGWLGVGNINLYPMFLDPSNQWFCLHEQSPCIDSGDVNILDPEDPFNIGYALWPARGTIRSDMGAFGGPYACNWDPIITGLEKKSAGNELIPSTITLFQNYPNPFNPSTAIEFTLPQSGFVTLKIYNIIGEELATLVSDRLTAGNYKYDWNASGLASGVYLYCLEAGAFKQTKKLILLK